MQVWFSRELNRRLEHKGATSNSVESGVVATNLSTGITDNANMRRHLEQGISVEEGAITQVFICGSNQLNRIGGGHWAKCEDIRQRFNASHSSGDPPAEMDEAHREASQALIATHTNGDQGSFCGCQQVQFQALKR